MLRMNNNEPVDRPGTGQILTDTQSNQDQVHNSQVWLNTPDRRSHRFSWRAIAYLSVWMSGSLSVGLFLKIINLLVNLGRLTLPHALIILNVVGLLMVSVLVFTSKGRQDSWLYHASVLLIGLLIGLY